MSLLFFRKKKEDSEEVEESESETDDTSKKADSKSGYRLAAQVEKLKAKVDVISEMRKTDSERFSRISEEIGEMRNLILEKEQEIEKISEKATKAEDLVEELKPESISSELRKFSVGYERSDAKIEAINSLYGKVLDELKDVRNKLAVFRGTEELIKLNNETAENLARIKKSEAAIEQNAAKVGNTFIQFQKQFSDFSRFKDWSEAVQEEYKKMADEFSKIKIKADSALIGRKDLDAVRSELKKDVQELHGKLSKGKEGLTVERMNSAEKRLELIESSIKKTDQLASELKMSLQEHSVKSVRDEMQSRLSEIDERVVGISSIEAEKNIKNHEKVADARMKRLEDCFAALNSRVNNIAGSIEKKQDAVEELREDLEKKSIESKTPEDEYYELAKEIEEIAKQGMTREAIVKYNMLKEMYNQLARRADFAGKSDVIYAALKAAFEAVNESRRRKT